MDLDRFIPIATEHHIFDESISMATKSTPTEEDWEFIFDASNAKPPAFATLNTPQSQLSRYEDQIKEGLDMLGLETKEIDELEEYIHIVLNLSSDEPMSIPELSREQQFEGMVAELDKLWKDHATQLEFFRAAVNFVDVSCIKLFIEFIACRSRLWKQRVEWFLQDPEWPQPDVSENETFNHSTNESKQRDASAFAEKYGLPYHRIFEVSGFRVTFEHARRQHLAKQQQ